MKKYRQIFCWLILIGFTQAMQNIQNLPEVKVYKKEVESSPLKGKFVIHKEETDSANIYHEFFVGEGLKDHVTRWNTFGVDKKSGEVFVMDRMKGKYIPYSRWKKQ